MINENFPIYRIKIWMVIGLLAAMTGCAGYYDGGADYDEAVGVSEPDMYLFGGDYDRGRDAHHYSRRGSESRGAIHSGGSHPAAHSGAGRGGRR